MNLLIIDLETTGLDTDNNGILSISAKVFDKNRKVVTFFDAECNPDYAEIDLGALKVNRYSIDKIKSLRNEKDIVLQFCDWLLNLNLEGELVLGGHNPHFDISFIKTKLKKYNIAGFDKAVSHRVLDTASIGRFLVLAGVLKDTKVSLKDLALALNIEYDAGKHHTSKYDVDLTARLLFAMIDKVGDLNKG